MQTRMRVAGIWLDDDHILLESLVELDVWGVPGGGLEADEMAEAGIIREYREELGLEMRCLHLAILNENFWSDKGQPVREYCFYFLVEPVDQTLTLPGPMEPQEDGLKFAWFPLSGLNQLDVVPPGLPHLLARLSDGTIFISTHEGFE